MDKEKERLKNELWRPFKGFMQIRQSHLLKIATQEQIDEIEKHVKPLIEIMAEVCFIPR